MPWMFRVGTSVVILGLDILVRGMKQGGEIEACLEPGFKLFDPASKMNDEVNPKEVVQRCIFFFLL